MLKSSISLKIFEKLDLIRPLEKSVLSNETANAVGTLKPHKPICSTAVVCHFLKLLLPAVAQIENGNIQTAIVVASSSSRAADDRPETPRKPPGA